MLTGKQKSYLRSLAQTERPIFQVGKDGLSDNLIDQVSAYLKKNELVKVSILKTCPTDVKETGFDLAMHVKGECVQTIGRQVVIYKKGKEPQIILP